jgi:hypothetical protein
MSGPKSSNQGNESSSGTNEESNLLDNHVTIDLELLNRSSKLQSSKLEDCISLTIELKR